MDNLLKYLKFSLQISQQWRYFICISNGNPLIQNPDFNRLERKMGTSYEMDRKIFYCDNTFTNNAVCIILGI